MKYSLIQALGWVGVALVLGTHGLLSFGLMDPVRLPYQLLNGLAAIFIVLASLERKAMQSVVINIVWTIIAAVAIMKIVI
ncbi:MAG: hypothetical protein V1821_03475 [bacterium]